MNVPALHSPRIFPLVAAVLVIAAGLVWRLAPLGLPGFALKYGGSLLWGAMVGFLVAALAPSWPTSTIVVTASVIALASELFRLYHQPWLDAFRMTLAGALLLGRVFSLWNLAAYALGIGSAAWIARRARR